MADPINSAVDTDALSKLVSESGILNPNVKIADIMSTTFNVASMPGMPGGERSDSGDCFVHPGFVYFRAS